jgi:hypothetical protein
MTGGPRCDWCPAPAVRFTRTTGRVWAWCEDCFDAIKAGYLWRTTRDAISHDEWIVAKVQGA